MAPKDSATAKLEEGVRPSSSEEKLECEEVGEPGGEVLGVV